MSETDYATPTTTTHPCANVLNSTKKHINVLNGEITAMRSFLLEQTVILRKPTQPISDTNPGKSSQYVNALLEQINNHSRQGKKLTCFMQALIENKNGFQSIPDGSQKSRHIEFLKNTVTCKHAEDHQINISNQNIVSSSKFSALTDSKGHITNKHAEDHVITILV